MSLVIIEGRGAEHGRGKVIDRFEVDPLGPTDTPVTIYEVTSGRVFTLDTIVATNLSGTAIVNLYDSFSDGVHSGNPSLRLVVGAVKTEFIGNGEAIKGCTFVSSVIAVSNVSGVVWLYVGGTER